MMLLEGYGGGARCRKTLSDRHNNGITGDNSYDGTIMIAYELHTKNYGIMSPLHSLIHACEQRISETCTSLEKQLLVH